MKFYDETPTITFLHYNKRAQDCNNYIKKLLYFHCLPLSLSYFIGTYREVVIKYTNNKYYIHTTLHAKPTTLNTLQINITTA